MCCIVERRQHTQSSDLTGHRHLRRAATPPRLRSRLSSRPMQARTGPPSPSPAVHAAVPCSAGQAGAGTARPTGRGTPSPAAAPGAAVRQRVPPLPPRQRRCCCLVAAPAAARSAAAARGCWVLRLGRPAGSRVVRSQQGGGRRAWEGGRHGRQAGWRPANDHAELRIAPAPPGLAVRGPWAAAGW